MRVGATISRLVELTRRLMRSRPASQVINRSRRPSHDAFLMAALAAVLGLVSGRAIYAQAPPPALFTAVPNNQIADATPEQNQRLEQIRRRGTTQSVELVQINLEALKSNRLRIAVPGGGTLDLSKTGGTAESDRELTWAGAVPTAPGEQPANATFVVRNGDVTGSITNPGGLYRITPIGGGIHALVKVDTAKLPPEEPPSFRQKEQQRGGLTVPRADLNRADTGPTQIDVLVAYTPAAKAAVSNIDATIALAVAETNQSYVNSKVNIVLKLVDSFQVSYTESGKNYDTILADFVSMTMVNQHRDQSAADLAALIIDQADYCGLADAIMATASTAFAIVHYDCATGYYSFGHELGHLMGARHNQQIDPSTTPFAYGHGLRHDTAPSWRTVMSYDCPVHCARLPYWSNPNIQYGGIAMGTTVTNDNARVLNETRGIVDAFRTPVSAQFPVWGVISSAGKQSGTPNWSSTFNSAAKQYEIAITGENYYYLSAATVVTPSFGTGGRGFCTSGSVNNKLLIQCYDGLGNPVVPVSVGFASFKQPGQTGAYQGPLAFGAISSAGKKESGSPNWTSSFNPAAKQYEIAISGENYHYLSYATLVTPSFASGAEGFCTSSSVNSKLLIKCFDCSGNSVTPVGFGFATFKGAGPYQKPLAFGVVSAVGKKESGTANWSAKFNTAAKQYEITITGEKYYYLSYTTLVTPSFATGAKGFCTSGSVSDRLLVKCYNSSGNPVTPVSLGFATFKKP